MSLIVSQASMNKLPAQLVNNAAFVKQVDSGPVRPDTEAGQLAEQIHGGALPRFDTLSLSDEALAKVQRLSFADGTDTLSLDAQADLSQPLPQRPSVIDVTDPASVERQKQGEAMSRAMKSWNAEVDRLKQISSSPAYDYFETLKLFKHGYADWKASLQKSDPEAYGVWLRMMNEDQ